MLLHPAQKQIAADTHRFRIVRCGRRFGKTTEAVEEIKGLVIVDRDRRIDRLNLTDEEKRNIKIMGAQDEYRCRVNYWAETYKDARDIAWGMLLKELAPIILKSNEQRLEIIVRNMDGNKAIIKLRGWEAVESVRGTKSDFDIYDEVAKYKNFWGMWEEVLRPTLSDYIGEGIFYSTPKGFNHFYELYNLENTNTDYKSFHFTSRDNPYLAQSELDKARDEMTEDRYAQEYLADFRKTAGLVYKDFDRARHLYTPQDTQFANARVVERIAGVDFGFTNPAAVITILRDSDDNLWVDDEWYKEGKTDLELAEYVASQGFNRVYCDPANPAGIKEITNKKVNVRDVVKNKDSIQNGINKVREYLKSGKLRFNSKCTATIQEIEMYSYPDSKDGKEDENPLDEFNHAMDALRYPIMMMGGKMTATQYRPSGMDRSPTFNVISPEVRFAKQYRPKT